ncbi:MAG: DUF1501 domain-containing protein [Planctomycetota bacterium]
MLTRDAESRHLHRRALLRGGSFAMGSLAVTAMSPLGVQAAPLASTHPARAKRVIFLFMHGGPSHVDTFDYKPRLAKDDGKPLPFDLPPNLDAVPKLMNGPWKFAQRGASGLWVSDLLPHMADVADSLCVIRSMHTRGQSHGQAVGMINTGSDNLVRPSVGAWVSYALGSGHPDLPAHIAIGPATAHGGPRNYGAAFLPAIHQATAVGTNGKPGTGKIPHLTGKLSQDVLDRRFALLQQINAEHALRSGPDREIEGAVEAVDLARRMRSAAPDVFNLDLETATTKRDYGLEEKATKEFGRSCLLARRLIENGVRFVTVSSGQVWDQHSKLKSGHEKNALATDKPVAALIQDLKSRGLWDDTLIVWGGEFGRTPVVQGSNGRDHNPQGFSVVLSGGGVRSGFAYGETDEFGYYARKRRVHMHDLHATMLHLLGIDHKQLTYRYAGRDFRLTDVHGDVVEGVLA